MNNKQQPPDRHLPVHYCIGGLVLGHLRETCRLGKHMLVLVLSWGSVPSALGEAVLHYDFEQVEGTKVIDSSGNGYHGYIDSTNSYKPQKVAGGLRFRGAKNCVVVFKVGAMNVGNDGLTIEMVFEIEPDVSCWVNEGESPVLIGAAYGKQKQTMEVCIGSEGHLCFKVCNPEGEWTAVCSDAPVPVGKPVHLVATLSRTGVGNTVRGELYVNGIRQHGVLEAEIPFLDENRRFTLAAEEAGKRHLQGILHDVCLHARSLNGEEDLILKRGMSHGQSSSEK